MTNPTFAEGVLLERDLAVDGPHCEGAAGTLLGLRDRRAPALNATHLSYIYVGIYIDLH